MLEHNLVRSLLDHEQKIAFLDVLAILEVLFLKEPLYASADRHIVKRARGADRPDHIGDGLFRATTTVTWGCFVPSCVFSLAVHPATPSKAIAEQHTHARSRNNLTGNLGIVSPKWIMAVSVFWIARLLYRRLPREAQTPSPAHRLQSSRPIVEPDGPFVLYLLRS